MNNVAHTPGPWMWDVSPGGEIRLATPDRGRLFVMGFARMGMRGAQPRFAMWGEGQRERRGGIMHDFADAGGENHPDARLIAAAPELLAALERCLSWLTSYPGGTTMTPTGPYEQARKAIAKATGAL